MPSGPVTVTPEMVRVHVARVVPGRPAAAVTAVARTSPMWSVPTSGTGNSIPEATAIVSVPAPPCSGLRDR